MSIIAPDVPLPTLTVYVPVSSPAVLKFTVAKLVLEAPVEHKLPDVEITGTLPEGPVIVKFDPLIEIELQFTGSEKFTLNEFAAHK